MQRLSLIEIGFIGFLAQMVDGSIGMGYGVTSSAMLISLGFHPAVASATVHTSEVFTTLFSGLSHFKLGNADKRLFLPLVSFGVIGGVLGACGLLKVPLKPVKLLVGTVLFAMGGLIFYRFLFRYSGAGIVCSKGCSVKRLRALGFFAAFIDALGGGGWGPICTPALVVEGEDPGKAVGSVNLAEFFITLAISATFILLLGLEAFRLEVMLALMCGGVIAAPLAALLCRRMPKRTLGILVGLAVLLMSMRILLK